MINTIKKLIKSNERMQSLVKWTAICITAYKLYLIKRHAKKISKAEGCQVFVVRVNGAIRFITKKQLKDMRARRVVKKDFTADSLKRISLYYTDK